MIPLKTSWARSTYTCPFLGHGCWCTCLFKSWLTFSYFTAVGVSSSISQTDVIEPLIASPHLRSLYVGKRALHYRFDKCFHWPTIYLVGKTAVYAARRTEDPVQGILTIRCQNLILLSPIGRQSKRHRSTSEKRLIQRGASHRMLCHFRWQQPLLISFSSYVFHDKYSLMHIIYKVLIWGIIQVRVPLNTASESLISFVCRTP